MQLRADQSSKGAHRIIHRSVRVACLIAVATNLNIRTGRIFTFFKGWAHVVPHLHTQNRLQKGRELAGENIGNHYNQTHTHINHQA